MWSVDNSGNSKVRTVNYVDFFEEPHAIQGWVGKGMLIFVFNLMQCLVWIIFKIRDIIVWSEAEFQDRWNITSLMEKDPWKDLIKYRLQSLLVPIFVKKENKNSTSCYISKNYSSVSQIFLKLSSCKFAFFRKYLKKIRKWSENFPT